MIATLIDILLFIVEMLIYAIVGVVKIIRCAFSKEYREKCRQQRAEDRKKAPRRIAMLMLFITLALIIGYPISKLAEKAGLEPEKKKPNIMVKAKKDGEKTKLTFSFWGNKSSNNTGKLSFMIGTDQSDTNKLQISNWTYTKNEKTKSFPNQRVEPTRITPVDEVVSDSRAAHP